jgi:hypothetical protein
VRWTRVTGWVAAVIFVGLGVLFLIVGLDRADKVASVVGALSGVLGLGLAGYGFVQGRRPAVTPRADRGQEVTGTKAGNVHQVLGKQRIAVHRKDLAAPESGGGGSRLGTPETHLQSVRDSEIAGDVFQIDGDGDVHIER